MKTRTMIGIILGVALAVAAWFITFAMARFLICPARAENFGPPPNEGYCVGIGPENCYYAWTENQGRWNYNPFSEEDRQYGEQGTTQAGQEKAQKGGGRGKERQRKQRER